MHTGRCLNPGVKSTNTSLLLPTGEEAGGVQRRRGAAGAGRCLHVPADPGAQVSPPHLSSKQGVLQCLTFF